MLNIFLKPLPEEPVGNSDRLTLRELAYELRKILNFGYVTLEGALGDYYQLSFWQKKSHFVN